MTTIAELVVKITGDASGFNQTAGNVNQSAANLGRSATRAGIGLTAGLTLPIVGLGVAAVSASSDLEESINAANVVFGDANATILEFGENAATAVGLANSEFNSLATVTGAFLQNVGFNAQGAAEETINLATRAADMASVFNTEVATALNAIQSGLKGEFNPLEQFGVKINAAAIEAEAFALGLENAEGEIDDNAKATAALNLIYGQTALLAGDFANTQEGVANASKIARAELANAAAEIGDQLIPVASLLISVVRDVISWFTNLPDGVKTAILIFLGLAAVIGPLLIIFGAIVGAVTTLLPLFAGIGGAIALIFSPIGLLVAALIGLGIVIVVFGEDAWNTFMMIVDIVVAVIQRIIFEVSNFFSNLIATWTTNWDNLVLIVRNIFNIDWGAIGLSIIRGIAGGITSGISFLVGAVGNAAGAVVDGFKNILGISSPSVLMAQQVGLPIAEGIGKGIDAGIAKVSPNIDALMAGMTMPQMGQGQGSLGTGQGAQAGGTTNNITINNPVAEPASESIPNAMRKLAFLGVTT